MSKIGDEAWTSDTATPTYGHDRGKRVSKVDEPPLVLAWNFESGLQSVYIDSYIIKQTNNKS